MSYQAKVATHNTKIRLLLFFLRPLHLFNFILLIDLWRCLQFGPSHLKNYFGNLSAAGAAEWLWQEQFSGYIWWFIGAVALEILIQEFLPVMRQD